MIDVSSFTLVDPQASRTGDMLCSSTALSSIAGKGWVQDLGSRVLRNVEMDSSRCGLIQKPLDESPHPPALLIPLAPVLCGKLPSSYRQEKRAGSDLGAGAAHPAEPSLTQQSVLLVSEDCAPSAGCTTAGLAFLLWFGPFPREGSEQICSLLFLRAKNYHRGRAGGESCVAKSRNWWERCSRAQSKRSPPGRPERRTLGWGCEELPHCRGVIFSRLQRRRHSFAGPAGRTVTRHLS